MIKLITIFLLNFSYAEESNQYSYNKALEKSTEAYLISSGIKENMDNFFKELTKKIPPEYNRIIVYIAPSVTALSTGKLEWKYEF